MNALTSVFKKRINYAVFASTVVTTPVASSAPLLAAVEFDQRMLWGGESSKNAIDLSRFSRGNPVFPGTYSVQYFLNDYFIRDSNVTFVASVDGGNATPCFLPAQMAQMGLNLKSLQPTDVEWISQRNDRPTPVCKSVEEIVPYSSAQYDSSEQRLDVYIPQAYLHDQPKDYIDPSLWDSGITAGRLNYSLNAFHSEVAGQESADAFLQLDAGFNAAGWRFRQSSSLNKNEYEQHYEVLRTYAQTDLHQIKSTVTLGESYTEGQAFDSFGIKGLLLATDDRMLPASHRGYAPLVRGTANTNAKVTITQGGVTLYQKAVAPGPFEIKDLDPIGYGSDLVVTVSETDGQSRTYTVPYASSAQLLRPGQLRYSAAVGQASTSSMDHYTPNVAQIAGFYGLNNSITPYAGGMASDDYRAIVFGTAVSTPIGGISADVTYAQNRLDTSASNGSSLRLIYSTLIDTTNTNITLSSYRYSTEGYWSFNDLLLAENSRQSGSGYEDSFGRPLAFNNKQKSRFNVNLNQSLAPGWGNIYFSGETSNYWNREGRDTFYQVSYNNSFKKVRYTLSANRSIDENGAADNQIYLSFNMPLFPSDKRSQTSLSGRSWHSDSGGGESQLAVSGVTGVDQEYSYNLSTNQPMSGNDKESSYSASGGYQGATANVTAGVTAERNSQHSNVGISGGVIAHAGGITFSQSLGETVALIEAENAGGARITNAYGAAIDNGGYGVAPYLSPYNRNRIELDSLGLSTDVQLDSSSTEVIPAAGSIVKVRFSTSKESSGLIVGKMADGSPLPFGAEVFDSQTRTSVGFVGQGGYIFARGVEDQGKLIVQLHSSEKCSIDYAFPVKNQENAKVDSLASTSGICVRTI